MEDHKPQRSPLKTHRSNWKEKLRENCFKRVRADRNRLLWKMRSPSDPSPNHKDIMEFTFRNIVSDELKKIKDSSVLTSVDQVDDALWEYDGLHRSSQSTESECEDIMIEMQRIFYEDLREEETRRESEDYKGTWEEEDDYLAALTLEQLLINHDEVTKNEVWCPICKRGELREDHHLIYCTRCKLQLNRDDEVNLELLRAHLADAHTDHLVRGCRLTPKFCMETRFNLTALYIQCEACNIFEIVL